jgi:hypothetical protein
MLGDDTMHQDFSRWYATVSLADESSKKEIRWNGVEAVVADIDADTIEALLRLAFGGRSTPSLQAVQKIRESFRNEDDTFEMSGNDRELRVLSGAALVAVMEDRETDVNFASLAALGAATACFGRTGKIDLPMDLAGFAESAIVRLGDETRRRPDLEAMFPSEPPKVDFDKAATKVRDQPNWEGVAAAFALAAEASRTAMRTLAQRNAKALKSVSQFLGIQDEELEMLWWLTGRRSFDMNCSFDAVEPEVRPLVFAAELARATWALPGPRSIAALLERAGVEKKQITIPEAINSLPVEWLKAQVQNAEPSPLSQPLHFAIKRQLETGVGNAWVAGWAAASEIDASFSVLPLELSIQFYRERLQISER